MMFEFRSLLCDPSTGGPAGFELAPEEAWLIPDS